MVLVYNALYATWQAVRSRDIIPLERPACFFMHGKIFEPKFPSKRMTFVIGKESYERL